MGNYGIKQLMIPVMASIIEKLATEALVLESKALAGSYMILEI